MPINNVDGAYGTTHNGVTEHILLESSDLKRAQCPSFSHSIALKMQNSTACDWFANSCESIFDISHSYASGFTVTLRRILRDPLGILGIQCQSMPNNLNINEVVWQTTAYIAAGLNNHGRMQSISGSYAGDQDDKEVCGDPNGREQHTDCVSGAEHPCCSSGFTGPFSGAGVRIAHEEGRFRSGIDAVRAVTGVRGCAA